MENIQEGQPAIECQSQNDTGHDDPKKDWKKSFFCFVTQNKWIFWDAIKQNLIPEEVTAAQASIIYAEEADVLNVAMFGQTAKQWREAHPELKGNIRDYASINELICLANMENINAVLIDEGVPQGDRLVRLNQIAINQMRVLENDDNRNLLKWHEWIGHNIETT